MNSINNFEAPSVSFQRTAKVRYAFKSCKNFKFKEIYGSKTHFDTKNYNNKSLSVIRKCKKDIKSDHDYLNTVCKVGICGSAAVALLCLVTLKPIAAVLCAGLALWINKDRKTNDAEYNKAKQKLDDLEFQARSKK